MLFNSRYDTAMNNCPGQKLQKQAWPFLLPSTEPSTIISSLFYYSSVSLNEIQQPVTSGWYPCFKTWPIVVLFEEVAVWKHIYDHVTVRCYLHHLKCIFFHCLVGYYLPILYIQFWMSKNSSIFYFKSRLWCFLFSSQKISYMVLYCQAIRLPFPKTYQAHKGKKGWHMFC